MKQVGNKHNSYLNGDWGKHTKDKGKTSKARRREERLLIAEERDLTRKREHSTTR